MHAGLGRRCCQNRAEKQISDIIIIIAADYLSDVCASNTRLTRIVVVVVVVRVCSTTTTCYRESASRREVYYTRYRTRYRYFV